MERVMVESSSLKSAGYDPATRLLEVEFQSGRVYQYEDVPPEVYTGLIEAESLGRYFNDQIREKYPTRQVE